MAGSRSLNPTVEDYQSSDDDDSGVVTDSFARRASPASANVAAKRSKSSEMGADKAAEGKKEQRLPTNIDLQSDSGYSSHTAATMSSADSAPSASAKSQSPPVAAAQPPQPPPSPTLKRRGTLSSKKREVVADERESPRKPLGRSGSVSSRQPRERRSTRGQDAEPECKIPNCTKCEPHAASSRGRPARPGLNPISTSAVNGSYDAQSRVSSDPSTYQVPQSPRSRPPSYYGHGPTVIQPGMPRRSSSQSRGARPMSYHGEAGQGFPGWMPNQLPSPPQDVPGRGPPPAGSAYWSMQRNPQMHHYGATPPSNGYYPHPAQPYYSPPYEQPQHARPPLTHQTQSFSARGPQGPNARPLSQYNTVINQQEFPGTGSERKAGPSARYHDPPPSATRSKFEESSSDEYESSSEEDYEEEERRPRTRKPTARELMPPPEFKPTSRRRESDGMSQSMILPERHRERDPKASRVSTTTTSSRAPSRSRPKVLQQKAQTTYEVPTRSSNRNSQVYVENPKSSRRQSYVGYEDQAELKQKHRNSKIYAAESQAEPKPRRRQTQGEYDPRREQELDDRMDGINAYMSKTRGNEIPYTDQIHNAAKRASTRASNPSESGSRRSRHSDDNKSRMSRATSTTNAGGGEIRLKLALDTTPLNLEFKGDMAGRTLQINPAEDGSGMAELVIGQKETVYRSERGSVAGSEGRRKLIANNARRDAEERSSIRSVHSSQGRRTRDDDRELRRRIREGIYYEH